MFNVTLSPVTSQIRIQVWMGETLKPYYALQACVSLCQIHDILLPFFSFSERGKMCHFFILFYHCYGDFSGFISFFVFLYFILYIKYLVYFPNRI